MCATLDRLAVRAWLKLATPSQVDDWAETYVAENEPDPDVLELFGEPYETKVDVFLALAERRFGFALVSVRGAEAVSVVVGELCREVLDGQLDVVTLCAAVCELEPQFCLPADAGTPYPEGLYELYNACDWCDERWTLQNQPHLQEIFLTIAERLRSP
jgi:hypothetical protein